MGLSSEQIKNVELLYITGMAYVPILGLIFTLMKVDGVWN